MEGYTIRQVTSMVEIHGIVEIQRKAWKMPDLEIVATFEMKAVSSFGAVIVAVDNSEKPIGFIYAFPKFPDIHYSHMMATLPEWQGKGVGYEMKKFHRNMAINSKTKINSIIWTVDPLLSNNAFLNFAKLGGICKTYYPNYYGDPEVIGIYKGLPTDRFLLEWHIHSEKVYRRMDDYTKDRITLNDLQLRSPQINTIMQDGKYMDNMEVPSTGGFSVEVPADFQGLKETNLQFALEWRFKFREICQMSFERGYCVNDFHSFTTSQGRRNFFEFSENK